MRSTGGIFDFKLKSIFCNGFLSIVYLIPYRNFDLLCIGETRYTAGISLKEHRRSFEKLYMHPITIIYLQHTDHIASFDNIRILDTCCKHYEARTFHGVG